MAREPTSAAKDLGFFLIGGLGEISGSEHLIAMDGQKALDGAEEKSNPFFAVAEGESPSG